MSWRWAFRMINCLCFKASCWLSISRTALLWQVHRKQVFSKMGKRVKESIHRQTKMYCESVQQLCRPRAEFLLERNSNKGWRHRRQWWNKTRLQSLWRVVENISAYTIPFDSTRVHAEAALLDFLRSILLQCAARRNETSTARNLWGSFLWSLSCERPADEFARVRNRLQLSN